MFDVEPSPVKPRELVKPVKGHLAPATLQAGMFTVDPRIDCDSNASARNAFGTAAEEIAFRLLGITRIPINGKFDICFDGKRGAMYYEVKSTGIKGGKVVLYDWRMGKDAAAGVPLTYIIVCHSVKGCRSDVFQTMLDRPLELLLLPAPVIHELALQCPINHLKTEQVPGWSKRSGYAREGYADGYRNLPLATIKNALTWTTTTLSNPWGQGSITQHTYYGE